MSSTVHAGVFELMGISGASLARAKEALGIRLVFPHEYLGVFDGKEVPLSLSAAPVQAPDLSYVSFEWQVPVTFEGIRKYAGWPRHGVNSPSIFNYSKGEAARVKIEWSYDGKEIKGRYTSDIEAKFALIVNGCFEPATIIEASKTSCILKQETAQLSANLKGEVEEPIPLDDMAQLDRAWVGLTPVKGTQFLAYPVTIGPKKPLLFSLTLDGKAGTPDIAHLDTAALNYENSRMKNTGVSAGAAEAVASLSAYGRAYDPKRCQLQTTVNRTWGGINRPGLVFGWDNFFMSYSVAWENPQLGAASLEHVVGVYGERGIENGPAQRNLIIPVIYCRTISIIGDYELAKRTWPTMIKFMHFFFEQRDGNGDGLIELGSSMRSEKDNPGRIIQNAMDESGYDELPNYSSGFSEKHRGIPAKGVSFDWKSQCLTITTVCQNALYVAASRAMEALARKLGYTADADWLKAEGKRVATKMDELLYNKEQGIHRDRYWAGGFSPTKTMTLFFPLMANLPDERGRKVLQDMLTDPKQFWGENVIPTVSRDDEHYCDGIDRKGNYWRGNCWAPTTYMVYLSAKEAGWDSIVAEYGKRAAAQFMEYWSKHVHAYENYPPEGKVDHDFLYVTMWGGRESHYVWAAMQLMCVLEEIFGLEIDGKVRFGNPHLETQSSWKNFLYRGKRVEAEAGASKTYVRVEGEWEFSSDSGVVVRNFEALGSGKFTFDVSSEKTTTIALSQSGIGSKLLANGKELPAQKSGDKLTFKLEKGAYSISLE